MPSTFPAALDNIAANKSDSTAAANDHAPHHNALADAINAVQGALGANLANVVAASDARLTDARTPTAHKSTHATGGTDALTPADIGAEVAGAASAAVAAHVAAADPHPDYTTAAEAAAAAPVQSVAGRTGAVTLAKADVGLSNVDNTSDSDKPISTATQTALNGKANTSHTHVAADVTDFSAAADARIAASDKVSSNVTGITGADQITNIVSLTQAEYDAIGSKSGSTLYVIAG